jgi:hypothetical protein
MTGSGWFGYTRRYATSDYPITLVSQDKDEALDAIFELQRQEVDHDEFSKPWDHTNDLGTDDLGDSKTDDCSDDLFDEGTD